MVNVPYKRDIPDAPNNPSNDQPDMRINTNSLDTLIIEDHYGFGINDGGKHKQVQLPSPGLSGNPVFPATGGQGTLCGRSTGIGSDAQLFWSFAANPALQITNIGASVATNPGAVPLMGGLIMQYGIITGPAAAVDVTFANGGFFVAGAPALPYSVVLTPRTQTGSTTWSIGSITSTKFVFTTAAAQVFHWIAIGPYN